MSHHNVARGLAAGAAILFLTSAALAQVTSQVQIPGSTQAPPAPAPVTTDPNATMTTGTFVLGTVDVSGGRLQQSPGASDFISQDQMELLDLNRVTDALNTMPGVNYFPGTRGGARNEQGIYLRGFNSTQVPILVDGIPIYVPYDGYVDLSRFLTMDLSGIEISKGYASVLYGPNALGGVVNLVTRRPTRPIEFDSQLRANFNSNGSFKGFLGSVQSGSRMGNWYVQGGIAGDQQNFTRLSNEFTAGLYQPTGNRLQSFSRDLQGNAKIGYTPNATDEYVIGTVLQSSQKGAPPYAGTDPTKATFFTWPYYNKETYYALSNTQIGDTGYVKTRFYLDKFQNALKRYDNACYCTQRFPYAFSSSYNDYTVGAIAEAGVGLFAGNTLRGTFQVKQDVHREQSVNSPISTMKDFTTSVGLESTQILAQNLTWVVGASYDKMTAEEAQNPLTQNKTSFNLNSPNAYNLQTALTYDFNPTDRIYASVSRKNRFATMLERYSYRLGFGIPNPYLNPETAVNYQIGFAANFGPATQMTGAAFYSTVNNLIQAQVVGNSPTPPYNQITQYQNIGQAVFKGLEAGITTTAIPRTELGFTYTYLLRESQNNPQTLIYGTPHNKGYAWANVDLGAGFSLVPSLMAQSSMFTTNVGNGLPVSGFIVANLKVQYTWQALTAELGVNNLFDKNYQFDNGYPQEGRNFFTAVRLKF